MRGEAQRRLKIEGVGAFAEFGDTWACVLPQRPIKSPASEASLRIERVRDESRRVVVVER